MAILMKADGTITTVHPKDGVSFQLDELQAFVGGYIEIIHLKSKEHCIMVVNEEGLIIGLPFNRDASLIYGSPLVGDVLMCNDSEVL